MSSESDEDALQSMSPHEREQLRLWARSSTSERVAFFEQSLAMAHASGALDPARLALRNIVYFFALQPDEETCRAIRKQAESLADMLGLKHSLLRGNYHITLIPPGAPHRLRAEPLVSMMQAGDAVVSAPIDVVLDTPTVFPAPRQFPLVLGADATSSAAILGLAERLRVSLIGAGFKPDRMSTPHLTLAYLRDKGDELQPMKQPIRWRANEFVLVASHQGQSRHEVVKRWKLSED